MAEAKWRTEIRSVACLFPLARRRTDRAPREPGETQHSGELRNNRRRRAA